MTAEGRTRRSAWHSELHAAAGASTWKDIVWKNLEDYCDGTTLHGYRYLTEPGRHWVERLVWIAVHILAAWGTTYIILGVRHEYLNTPTVTTVDTTAFPISRVPFPAVAVCNVNKISLSKARRLAQQLAPSRNVSVDTFLQLMWNLGKLYDFDSTGHHKLTQLHALLTAGNYTYNVSQIMDQLNPSCDDLLVRCMWKAEIHDCDTLFEKRRTMEGLCCTFNYVRESDNFVSSSPDKNFGSDSDYSDYDSEDLRIKRSRSPGYRMGLTVLVNPQIHDYYYPIISSHGAKVLVYNPRDFPDTPSGGLIEKLVPPDTEVFFRLEATSVYAVPAVKGFHLSQRNCLFKSELSHLFAGSYSYSDCLMKCRVKSIHALCGCVPFYLPSSDTSRDCDMSDVRCLGRNKGKWATLRPTESLPGLEKEMEMSTSCVECYPACSDSTYHVQTTLSRLAEHRHDTSLFLDGLSNLSGHSVFHMFFGTYRSTLLKQDVLYYWYDLMSNFGGICGLFIGFSLISVVELFYFFTFRLFFHLKDSYHIFAKNEVHVLTGPEKNEVYWSEIVPPRHNKRY